MTVNKNCLRNDFNTPHMSYLTTYFSSIMFGDNLRMRQDLLQLQYFCN